MTIQFFLLFAERACSNPRYSWVTYFILSNLCKFAQLVLSTHFLLFYQFWSPYQSFVVLSNFCQFLTPCYLLTFYVIWQPINALAVHTTNTTLTLALSCARSLRQYTFRLTRRLWPSCHSDHGGIGPWLGVSSYNKQICFIGEHVSNLWLLLIFVPVTPRSQPITSRSPLSDGLGLRLLTPSWKSIYT